ncbi:MAG: hypothetical protein KME30_29300 [Iphinoe sp. HA4291-MV1]|jgi:hypothetical protein|nr:hypothetical protein [Iphinoe sp. HA4291-MV1]
MPEHGEKDTEQQTEENLPNPEDYYDRNEVSHSARNATQGEASRLQRLIERGKNAIERAKPVAQLVGKYLKEESTERIAKLAAKEAVVGEVPIVNVGVAVYEIYDFGKDLKHFIDEAKIITQNEAKLKRPFHEIAKEKREHNLKLLDANGEVTRLSRINKFHEQNPNVYFVQNQMDHRFIEQLNKVKARSFEEQISQKASEPNAKAQIASHFTKVERISESFQREYLIGSVFDNYNYALATARKELGEQHFNLVHHPQRGTEFDRFTAEWLYTKGFSKTEVSHAIYRESPFRQLVDVQQHLPEKGVYPELDKYTQKTLEALSPNLDRIRDNVQGWQFSKGSEVSKGHISPHQFEQYKDLKIEAMKEAALKKEDVDTLSRKRLAEYISKNAQENHQGTDLQYILERGRVLEAGQTPNDLKIMFKLHAAGHEKGEVIEVLKNFSPHSNDGVNYGFEKYNQLEQYLKQPNVRTKLDEVIKLKQENPILQQERRLDRLGLSHNQYEGGTQTYTDASRSATVTRTQQRRDIEREN